MSDNWALVAIMAVACFSMVAMLAVYVWAERGRK